MVLGLSIVRISIHFLLILSLSYRSWIIYVDNNSYYTFYLAIHCELISYDFLKRQLSWMISRRSCIDGGAFLKYNIFVFRHKKFILWLAGDEKQMKRNRATTDYFCHWLQPIEQLSPEWEVLWRNSAWAVENVILHWSHLRLADVLWILSQQVFMFFLHYHACMT